MENNFLLCSQCWFIGIEPSTTSIKHTPMTDIKSASVKAIVYTRKNRTLWAGVSPGLIQ